MQESKERIRSSIRNSGAVFPQTRKVVNLAPAQIKKQGVLFDLPIAASILVASGQLAPARLKDSIIIGELSLDGSIRPVNGVLPITQYAKESGFKKIILPEENAAEAKFIEDIEIYPVKNLRQFMEFISGRERINKLAVSGFDFAKSANTKGSASVQENLFSRLIGLFKAKRALTIAAAGHHNILFYGSPGCGKTVLARCIKNILTEMDKEEAMECTKIYSIAGLLQKENPIINSRPFREVHHTASTVSVVGGGGHNPKPGEITLAHNGVLFLDEIAEFNKDALEALRQPLEDKRININRSNFSVNFPCDFMLLATMNPCPCGYKGDKKVTCICTDQQIKNYQKKISGPLLDRFDIFLEVEKSSIEKMFENGAEEENIRKFKQTKELIEQAAAAQKERFCMAESGGKSVRRNADMEIKEIKKHCRIDGDSKDILNKASENLQISNRGYLRTLRLARTIADMEKSESIKINHIMEALQYRIKF